MYGLVNPFLIELVVILHVLQGVLAGLVVQVFLLFVFIPYPTAHSICRDRDADHGPPLVRK